MISDLTYPLIRFDALADSSETLTFKTTVGKSSDGLGEFRVSKSVEAVQSFSYKFATYKNHLKLFEILNSEEDNILIAWMDDFTVQAIDGYIEGNPLNAKVGDIYTDETLSELYCVTALSKTLFDDSTIEAVVFDKLLDDGLSTITRVLVCTVQADVAVEYNAEFAKCTIECQNMDTFDTYSVLQFPQLLGFDVIEFDLLKDSDFNSFQDIRESEQYDNGFTPLVQQFQWSKSYKLINLQLFSDSLQSLQNLKSTFCHLKGQLKSFWTPYYLTNFSNLSRTGSTVHFSNVNVSKNLKAVRVQYTDGSISYNVVQSFTDDSMVIDSLSSKPIKSIFELAFVRLNSDQLQITYQTSTLTTANLTCMEIEYV